MTKPIEDKTYRIGNSEIERITFMKEGKEYFNYYCGGVWFISLPIEMGSRKADKLANNYV